MKKSIFTKGLALFMALLMVCSVIPVTAFAANSGKYIKDVFVAYGKDKATADQWLKDHGWEPFADLNEGKISKVMKDVAAVLGIKRTSDPNEAITDMATMNMLGDYSFDDYENLVKEKKADIDEFIKSFIPALEEYRDNYNGKGSAGGKKRAQMAHDLLNKFYDGDPKDPYAVNDTGKALGDLFLNKTKTEIGDAAYNALSAEKKQNTADFQQIILESSGPAVLSVEQALALATDTQETSWLDRLNGMTNKYLLKHVEEFAPEAKGQNLAASAVKSLLAAHFEDDSKKLAADWKGVREDILWYEAYCDAHELWQEDFEEDDVYNKRVDTYFGNLEKESAERYKEELDRFLSIDGYYYMISNIHYSGEWGSTLYDFFNPEDEKADYTKQYDYFAPIAFALSKGQRASLEFLKLPTLLRVGADSDAVVEATFPKVSDAFQDKSEKELENISIYSGINRAIFRKGVALTKNALDQKNMGKDPYGELWDEDGIVAISSYCVMASGVISMVTGAAIAINAARHAGALKEAMWAKDGAYMDLFSDLNASEDAVQGALDEYNKARDAFTANQSMSTVGKWLMGIGGAMMIIAAVIKAVQMYEFYHRTFTQIPTMIVDEADIVSYTPDENGKSIKNINFDQFDYYEVVKCNRQEVGLHVNAQKGVSSYVEWGCGDAADLNADIGKQWLALYVNRSPEKGNPILADSLTIQYKDTTTPEGCNGYLHMFGVKDTPVKLDNMEYCYRADKGGIYLFWNSDAAAYTSSAFSQGGVIAISAAGGLIAGILGATAVLLPKRKKREAVQTQD
ncbi:MAG: hypothetical protein E7517_01750 [Ruminococcaceae bacterium]|nr:hypothetical protein [Oscillospiraceae bacterium]